MWYVFYPVVASLPTIITIHDPISLAFSNLLQNVWTWLAVIMLFVLLVWVFVYTAKRDS
jgi:hypothetical protein